MCFQLLALILLLWSLYPQIAIEYMFTNQNFTEIKAVINEKRYKYVAPYLSRDYIYQRIHPLRDAAFDTD